MPKVNSYDKQRDAIREQFKIALAKKNWKQTHLAELCGFSDSQISRIINTPDKCRYISVCEVAKKLGIKEIKII